MYKLTPLPVDNALWANPAFYVEEQFSGIYVTFSINPDYNRLKSGNRDLHHAFTLYRDLPLYQALGNTVFSAIVVPPEGLGRGYLKTLVGSGVLRSERLQHSHGEVRLVLTDISMLRGVGLTGLKFKERRVYLEDLALTLVERGLVPHVMISDVVKSNKREFFDFVCQRGSRGVLLKDSNGGWDAQVFKVDTDRKDNGAGNVTLQKHWQDLPKQAELLDEFDYDAYLAVQLLNHPKNEHLLLTS